MAVLANPYYGSASTGTTRLHLAKESGILIPGLPRKWPSIGQEVEPHFKFSLPRLRPLRSILVVVIRPPFGRVRVSNSSNQPENGGLPLFSVATLHEHRPTLRCAAAIPLRAIGYIFA